MYSIFIYKRTSVFALCDIDKAFNRMYALFTQNNGKYISITFLRLKFK